MVGGTIDVLIYQTIPDLLKIHIDIYFLQNAYLFYVKCIMTIKLTIAGTVVPEEDEIGMTF